MVFESKINTCDAGMLLNNSYVLCNCINLLIIYIIAVLRNTIFALSTWVYSWMSEKIHWKEI